MRSSASMDCFHACASQRGRALSTTEINFIKNLGKSKFWFVNVCVYMHTNSHLQCSLLELFSFICHS